MDSVSDELFGGIKFRALTVVDNSTRERLAIEVAQSLTGDDVVCLLTNIAAERRRSLLRIQANNESEFVSLALDKWLFENGVTLDFSRPGKLTDNAFIKSFNGSLRDESLNTDWFMSFEDTEAKIETWKQGYNLFDRIHRWMMSRQCCLPSHSTYLNPDGLSMSNVLNLWKEIL